MSSPSLDRVQIYIFVLHYFENVYYEAGLRLPSCRTFDLRIVPKVNQRKDRGKHQDINTGLDIDIYGHKIIIVLGLVNTLQLGFHRLS